jgi:high affinity Mn2+ porin
LDGCGRCDDGGGSGRPGECRSSQNGLSQPHREYLAIGGQGFLPGDGALNYGREEIIETYYTAHLLRGLSASGGPQSIDHPGYNRDRGPVLVEMFRLHVEF